MTSKKLMQKQVQRKQQRALRKGEDIQSIHPSLSVNSITPENALHWQQIIGNQAVQRLVDQQREGKTPAEVSLRHNGIGKIARVTKQSKPGWALFWSKDKRRRKALIEGYMAAGNLAQAATEVAALFTANVAFATKLMQYKLYKHRNNLPMWTQYFVVVPAAYISIGGVANPGELVSRGDFSWVNNQAKGDYVLTVVQRYHNNQGAGVLVDLLKNHSLVNALEQHADANTFQAFVQAVPQLSAVFGAKTALQNAGIVAPTADQVALEIFNALLGQQHGLTGFSYYTAANSPSTDTNMGTVNQWLSGLKTLSRGPCSVLTNIFINLLKTYPALNIQPQVVEIADPVLTVPLNQIATQGYVSQHLTQGNVYDNANPNQPTGQVFFSGGGTGAAHTYVRVGNTDYDLLFGTVGPNVAAAVQEQFQLTNATNGVYTGKNTGRTLTRTPALVAGTANAATLGFNTYVLQ